ncbi:MAG: rhomboid family intramembrane serine protease [Bacteroidota bacterium]
MLDSIWNDVKQQFSYGNMITRIVIVNVAVFVLINLVKLILRLTNGWQDTGLYNEILHFLCISADPWYILTRPWTIFTNMFLHEGFMHILFNMLFLYWFGRIVGDLIGDRRILPLYLMGGLAGGLAFFISANLLNYGGGAANFALGASAAVMAIVLAAGVLAPDYIMRLILIGDVRLKYIVAVLVVLDLVSLANNINTGGHFAHLGGAVFGWFFVTQLQNGNDLSEPINRWLDRLNAFWLNLKNRMQGKAPRPRVVYRNKDKMKRSAGRPRASTDGNDGPQHQEKLDSILDKIKKSGYDSLSSEEKEFLFNASKK